MSTPTHAPRALHRVRRHAENPVPDAPRTSHDSCDARCVGLVRAVQAGDERAWAQLVGRFEAPLRSIAASYRLSAADVDDVLQVAWIRLFERVESIREPASIAGWLATTVRRECLHTLQRNAREQPTDDATLGERPSADQPDVAVLTAERRALLLRALGALPERHRRLMTVLATQPDLNYEQVGRALQMPVGSIGPIRARCLRRLERDPALRALNESSDRRTCHTDQQAPHIAMLPA